MFNEMGVIDCDGHVAEPFDLYTEYSEAEFRKRMPQRVDRDGERKVIVDGVMLANGVGIAATDELEPRDIVDVAPTLLYSLGLPVPKDFEGVVPESFFVDKFLDAKPITIGKPTSRTNGAQVDKSAIKAGAVDEAEMDEQEKEALMEQLQMLGYME